MQVCPGCIYLVEGTGQAAYCSTTWGNGFATNSQIVTENGISDASPFFQAIMSKAWLSQVSLPTFYLDARPWLCSRMQSLAQKMVVRHGGKIASQSCIMPPVPTVIGHSIDNEAGCACACQLQYG